jgi:hypothetical protein
VEAARVEETSVRVAGFSARKGTAKIPVASVHQTARQVVQTTAPDRVVDAAPLDEEDPEDPDCGRKPDHDRGPRGDEPRGGVRATSAAMTPISIIDISGVRAPPRR